MSPKTKRLPDPGGIFDSDAHRRVLGHIDHHDLPHKTRDTLESLAQHMEVDHRSAADLGGPRPQLLSQDDVAAIVRDLVREGYASDKGGHLKRTAKGTEALSAPVPEEDEDE